MENKQTKKPPTKPSPPKTPPQNKKKTKQTQNQKKQKNPAKSLSRCNYFMPMELKSRAGSEVNIDTLSMFWHSVYISLCFQRFLIIISYN